MSGFDPAPLDAAAIISALNARGVRYVVIGAFAAIARQAPIPAIRDIDLTPEASADNLERLSVALKDLRARIRTETVPEGVAFDHDAASRAASDTWNLICRHGELDISFRPAGFEGGYAEIAANARRVRVDDVEVEIADLGDVITSKEAAGRPKDIRVLPVLYRHRRDHPTGRVKADRPATTDGSSPPQSMPTGLPLSAWVGADRGRWRLG